MRLVDAEEGRVHFLEERMGDEIRETYYVREGAEMVLMGCIQGDPNPPPVEPGHPEPGPRYRNICSHRNAYPLVAALPVEEARKSRWWWIGINLYLAAQQAEVAD